MDVLRFFYVLIAKKYILLPKKKKKPLNKLKFCKAIVGHEEKYKTKFIYKNLQHIKYHNSSNNKSNLVSKLNLFTTPIAIFQPVKYNFLSSVIFVCFLKRIK